MQFLVGVVCGAAISLLVPIVRALKKEHDAMSAARKTKKGSWSRAWRCKKCGRLDEYDARVCCPKCGELGAYAEVVARKVHTVDGHDNHLSYEWEVK